MPTIELQGADTGPADELRLSTDHGPILCRSHPCAGEDAILWVFGSGGGLGGPAGGLYTRLGNQLTFEGIASLELAYRLPGDLAECVLDVQAGAAWLEKQGKTRLILVGHSFGGAVVLNAAAALSSVIAVAALSSQVSGVGDIAALSPKALLFVHGEADEVLPASCSRELFARTAEPKELILYPGCRHGLDQCKAELDVDLTLWLRERFANSKT